MATPPTSNLQRDGVWGGEGTACGRVRQIDYFHLVTRGWSGGIGYHFLIGHEGSIYQGRPLDWGGAHAGVPAPNRNHSHIGIALLGSYSSHCRFYNSEQSIPTQAQFDSMWLLIDALINDMPTIQSIESHEPGDPGPWFYDYFESGTINTYRDGSRNN